MRGDVAFARQFSTLPPSVDPDSAYVSSQPRCSLTWPSDGQGAYRRRVKKTTAPTCALTQDGESSGQAGIVYLFMP